MYWKSWQVYKVGQFQPEIIYYLCIKSSGICTFVALANDLNQ